MSDRIAELRALEAVGTPGPWGREDVGLVTELVSYTGTEEFGVEVVVAESLLRQNCALIVALRNTAVKLLAVAEAAQNLDREDYCEWEICDACDGVGTVPDANFWCSECKSKGGKSGPINEDIAPLFAALDALTEGATSD